MRRFVISLVILVAGTGVVVSAASGAASGGTHYKTTVDATGQAVGGGNPNVFIEFGRVHSAARACIADRSMQMVANLSGGGHKVLDVGQSSRNGAYALVGNFTGATGGTIKVARKVIGSGHKRKICDAGSVPAD